MDHDGTRYEDLDDFIPINDAVEARVLDLETAIETAVSRIEYKIEHFPLKLVGLETNYELVFNFVLLIGSVIVAFIQEIT